MIKTIIITALFIMILGNTFAQSKITAVKTGSKIDVRINGSLFTSYIFSQEEKYPFFYPVNGISKASITSMRNGNYPITRRD